MTLRTGDGRYTESPETINRDTQALNLRARGRTLQQIADELGYGSRSHVSESITRHLRRTIQPAADEVRKTEIERLDHLYSKAIDVLEKAHLAVSNGRVVTRKIPVLDPDGSQQYAPDDDGKPQPVWAYEEVYDDGPVLAAMDRCLKIMERRARLLGLDAPTKTKVEISDKIDTEIARLAEQLKGVVAGQNPANAAIPEE